MADNTPGAARIIKTKRITHTVTSGEAAAQLLAPIDIVWDVPFADLNYSVSVNCELFSGAGNVAFFGAGGLSRTAAKITVTGGCDTTSTGAVVILHAIAIHD
jgi:hypothetical protein